MSTTRKRLSNEARSSRPALQGPGTSGTEMTSFQKHCVIIEPSSWGLMATSSTGPICFVPMMKPPKSALNNW